MQKIAMMTSTIRPARRVPRSRPASATMSKSMRSTTGSRSRNPYAAVDTMRTTTQSSMEPTLASTITKTGVSNNSTGLEKEYVYNLQQQVYFLELEAKLMREKLADPGPKVKDKGCAADPLDDPELDEAKPLDDHIKMLKMKYVEQKDQFKREHEEIMARQENLKEDVARRNRAIENLEAAVRRKDDMVAEAEDRFSDQRTEILMEMEGIRKEVEDRDRAIRQHELDRDHMLGVQAEQKEKNISLQASLSQVKDELRQATMGKASPVELERRQEEIAKLTIDVTDFRTSIEEMKIEIENAKKAEKAERDARWKVEGEVDEVRAALRLAERQNEMLTEQNKTAREQVATTKAQLDLLQTEHTNAKERIARLVSEKEDRDTEQRISFERSKQRADAAEAERADAVLLLKEARVEAAKQAQTMDGLQADIDKLNADVVDKDRRTDELANELAEERAKHREAVNRRDGAEANLAVAVEERSQAVNDMARYKAEADFMRQKSHIREDLDKLQQADFDRMKHTNDELTRTIASLSEKLNALASSRGMLEDMSKAPSAHGSIADRSEFATSGIENTSPVLPMDGFGSPSAIGEVADLA